MDESLRKLLDSIPERPPRSKLEPHAAVIRELRRKRRTYAEIAAFFREHLQLSVAPSTLHDFVKSRARRASSRVPEMPVSSLPEVPSARTPIVTPPVVQEAQAAMRPEENPFQFDVQEPLTLQPPRKQK